MTRRPLPNDCPAHRAGRQPANSHVFLSFRPFRGVKQRRRADEWSQEVCTIGTRSARYRTANGRSFLLGVVNPRTLVRRGCEMKNWNGKCYASDSSSGPLDA